MGSVIDSLIPFSDLVANNLINVISVNPLTSLNKQLPVNGGVTVYQGLGLVAMFLSQRTLKQ